MSKHLSVLCLALALVCGFMATPGRADTTMVEFSYAACDWTGGLNGLCGPGSITDIYTWEAPLSPTPTAYCQAPGENPPPGPFFGFGHCFEITADVYDTVNNTVLDQTAITFGLSEPTIGSGFGIPALNISAAYESLFTGANSSPTFTTGGSLIMWASDIDSPQVGTLTITTPEPASAPSLLGVGLLGVIGLWFRRNFGRRNRPAID